MRTYLALAAFAALAAVAVSACDNTDPNAIDVTEPAVTEPAPAVEATVTQPADATLPAPVAAETLNAATGTPAPATTPPAN